MVIEALVEEVIEVDVVIMVVGEVVEEAVGEVENRRENNRENMQRKSKISLGLADSQELRLGKLVPHLSKITNVSIQLGVIVIY